LAKNLRLTDTVTIASSGTTSTTLTLQGNRIPLAIIIPAAFTGTAVSLQASADDVTYSNVYDGSTQYSIGVSTSRYVALDRTVLDSVKYVRFVSTGTETASRSITVINGE
jgi:hypothetical protein